MGRNIAGVVVGYLVMFVVVMATFTGVFFVLGADRAFRAGSFEVTGLWAHLLAIVVVVLGVILAIPTLDAPEPGEPRTGDVTSSEAMMKAQQPPVVSFLNPVIGAVGVLLATRLRKPS